MLNNAVNSDAMYWKIHNLVKDEKDYRDCLTLFKNNMEFLKDVYLDLQSNSNFPFISMVELGNLCQKSKLIDERLKFANIDLLYISTYEKKQLGKVKQKSGLIRFEFLEFLFRVAKFKLVETRICKTYAEALSRIIEENLRPNYRPQPW